MPTTHKARQTRDARQRARAIAQRLAKAYPDATCALTFRNPLELLVATILSAQCTDRRVNMVTVELFTKHRTATDYSRADPADLENDIRSTGFFRNKARAIRECCRVLVDRFGGDVPEQIEELVELPGIGRKTANVILGTALGLATGVVVDTHVRRIAHRLGLTRHADPEKIERDLMQLLPQEEWINFSHRLIHHGRRVCTARNPACPDCPIEDLCPRIGVRTKKQASKP